QTPCTRLFPYTTLFRSPKSERHDKEEIMAQPATATDRAKRDSTRTGKKWVYLFREGNAGMRDLLGGKGAGCAEMTNAGLPVPPRSEEHTSELQSRENLV